jgi:hypothetical protein
MGFFGPKGNEQGPQQVAIGRARTGHSWAWQDACSTSTASRSVAATANRLKPFRSAPGASLSVQDFIATDSNTCPSSTLAASPSTAMSQRRAVIWLYRSTSSASLTAISA